MKSRDPETSPAAVDESFYSRWSKRKQAAREENPQEDELLPVNPVAEQPPALTDEDMPPLETLNENSDYTGFLSPRVSDELRRLALRKLFHAADFNLCDGLDDYAEDFTSFEKLGDIITSDMRFQMEQQVRKLAEQERLKGDSIQDDAALTQAPEQTAEGGFQSPAEQTSACVEDPPNPNAESDENGTVSNV